MTDSEMDGSKVVHAFTVLWPEWECDPLGWLTEDRRRLADKSTAVRRTKRTPPRCSSASR